MAAITSKATKVYQQWLAETQGSDKVSGSPANDRRTALIDYFRHHAEVMIVTEAAAGGVNLQFCSLLINYDLPWNPNGRTTYWPLSPSYGQI